MLESVLAIEKRLSQSIPADQQYCYEERNGYSVRIQCEEYSRTYHQEMEGMVEKRMRESILAIGSSWFTAWVDAGQPNLKGLLKDAASTDPEEEQALERSFQQGEIKGRSHGSR